MGGFDDSLGGEPHYLGHRKRLRARFREAGDGALADYELLELILFQVIPRGDVKPLAKAFLSRFAACSDGPRARTPSSWHVNGSPHHLGVCGGAAS